MVRRVLQEAAEMAVFEFFCALDGVSVIEDEIEKGELELHFLKKDQRIRLNDPNQEELHNLFNRLCFLDAENRPPNSEIRPYDVSDAKNLKSRLKSTDELDVHHVPDKYLSLQTVDGYDSSSAPAIALPKSEHRQIVPDRCE
jgi:hypothetical protein